MVAGALHSCIPDKESAQLKLMVTGALFQPALLADGAKLVAIVGAVLSRLIVTEVEAALPALSVAVPLTTCFAPSVLIVTGAGHTAMPEVLSEQAKVTVTSVLFHPKLSGAGLAETEMTGGSVSVPMIETVIELPLAPFS
jgi:hypothetical protein